MKYRNPKKINFNISEVGFGAWQLGNNISFDGMTDEEAIKLVHSALNKGITLFDTAPNYGQGNSERLLGLALKDTREQVFISTKFGHNTNKTDFSIEALEPSIKDSLERLQTKYLDSVILHNPSEEMLYGTHPIYDEFRRLKDIGLIKHYGVSIDHPHEMEIVLKHNNVDVIELMFNIIHQSPKIWFDEVDKQGILLLIKVPLDSGWLSGKYTKDTVFKGIRGRWTEEVRNTRLVIVDKIREIVGDNMVASALRFILNFKGVTTIIPGIRNIEQLNSNVMASDVDLPEDKQSELEALYENYIKNLNTPW